MAILCSIAMVMFLMVFVWPMCALLLDCVTQHATPADGFAITQRQFTLLGRSVWLSAAATALAVVPAAALAFGIGRSGRGNRWILTLGAVSLLCPPMVSVFGWQRILPAGVPPAALCVLVWALWLWPITYVMVVYPWSRMRSTVFEAARLETSTAKAVIHVAVPLVRGYLVCSGMLTMLLCLTDYSVPHACGLTLYATELLGWAANSPYAVDAVWPTLPFMLMVGVPAGISGRWWRRQFGSSGGRSRQTAAWPVAMVVLAVTVAWGTPLIALFGQLSSIHAVQLALSQYGGDVAWTLWSALVAGLACTSLGLLLAESRLALRAVIAIALLGAVLPGGLIGRALLSAFNGPSMDWLVDHWPIVSAGFMIRFGWIAFAVAAMAAQATKGAVECAATEGASDWQVFLRIRIPASLPTLVAACCVIVVLSAAEVPTTSFLRVPGFSPISLLLIEKFHRFEDDMLVSLSLVLIALGVVATAVATWVWRWRTAQTA